VGTGDLCLPAGDLLTDRRSGDHQSVEHDRETVLPGAGQTGQALGHGRELLRAFVVEAELDDVVIRHGTLWSGLQRGVRRGDLGALDLGGAEDELRGAVLRTGW